MSWQKPTKPFRPMNVEPTQWKCETCGLETDRFIELHDNGLLIRDCKQCGLLRRHKIIDRNEEPMKTEPNKEQDEAFQNWKWQPSDLQHGEYPLKCGFRAGWAARGKRQEPATEKTAEPSAGSIPVWEAKGMTKEEWDEMAKRHTSGFSQPQEFTWIKGSGYSDTFSDRLNALTKALEETEDYHQTKLVDDTRSAILAAIAKECGG